MKTKRKPKKKPSQPEVNLMEPIDFSIIGSVDDPCFGKLHDLKAEECGICGDSELCAIVTSQNLHLKRAKIEETTKFKDIEKIVLTRKELSVFIRGLLKKKKSLPLPSIKTEAVKILRITEALFDKTLKKLLLKSTRIKLNTKTNIITYESNRDN